MRVCSAVDHQLDIANTGAFNSMRQPLERCTCGLARRLSTAAAVRNRLAATRASGSRLSRRPPPPVPVRHRDRIQVKPATLSDTTPSVQSQSHAQPSQTSAAGLASPAAQVPVHVPDDPQGVLQASDPTSQGAVRLLSQSGLVIVRQLEMMNVFLGYEQANKYQILAASGEAVGFLAEEDLGFRQAIGRQFLRGHRAFKCTVMDSDGEIIMRVNRPLSLINSKIYISKGDDPTNVIGEAQQEWHLLRRKYNLFSKREEGFDQFGAIDTPFLGWDFIARNEDDKPVAAINRNFAGFARELFTDTGQYALKFEALAAESAPQPEPSSTGTNSDSKALTETPGNALVPSPESAALTLDQRAVLLAAAVSIDIDYFSRARGGGFGGGFMPIFWPMGGGSGAAEGAEAGAAGEAGQVGTPIDGTADGSGPFPLDQQADQPPRDTEPSPWSNEDVWGESNEGMDEGQQLEDPWAAPQEQGGSSWGSWGGGDSGGGDGGGGWDGCKMLFARLVAILSTILPASAIVVRTYCFSIAKETADCISTCMPGDATWIMETFVSRALVHVRVEPSRFEAIAALTVYGPSRPEFTMTPASLSPSTASYTLRIKMPGAIREILVPGDDEAARLEKAWLGACCSVILESKFTLGFTESFMIVGRPGVYVHCGQGSGKIRPDFDCESKRVIAECQTTAEAHCGIARTRGAREGGLCAWQPYLVPPPHSTSDPLDGYLIQLDLFPSATTRYGASCKLPEDQVAPSEPVCSARPKELQPSAAIYSVRLRAGLVPLALSSRSDEHARCCKITRLHRFDLSFYSRTMSENKLPQIDIECGPDTDPEKSCIDVFATPGMRASASRMRFLMIAQFLRPVTSSASLASSSHS
ncbi:uncharacterized protein L969DRAFT_95247 [Mixia osmundae IAM 14324]|uniref:Phospholipid scramblase n=1 Tax=Mixia osmundae (strain CBS 9802 / IAM 14324 / JCM 22182 / KY 12970) TaxID=764103 RepID=G7E6Q6_MIXOS|nr:uncharacterized protein L969DRAFT_95247 [Mixia osmundae IAM 14324]KEI39102.1 hypothetical protein L969DRAFT_95247 [Mixia osmundae IAM 14324]GAA98516.1 hypothetical protein E5Q_05202 [Mixia osmundae IAM 14324]